MEDSSTTDATLALYRDLRAAGYDNVGVVLQSRLRRTLDDVAGLDDVRLCKGIYLEPERDRVPGSGRGARELRALPRGAARAGQLRRDRDARRAADRRGAAARPRARPRPEQYEFQMLLGVRPELGDELVRDGHRLRIYVPFGTHWYEYSLRRLKENPQIAGYVAADVLRGCGPGAAEASYATTRGRSARGCRCGTRRAPS